MIIDTYSQATHLYASARELLFVWCWCGSGYDSFLGIDFIPIFMLRMCIDSLALGQTAFFADWVLLQKSELS